MRPTQGRPPPEMMRHRRDEAILQLMLESWMRDGEIVGLALADVDLPGGVAIVRRGKGGKGRVVPFGLQAALAIDRYLRTRSRHRLAQTCPDLWLGDRGKRLSSDALHKSLGQRADAAGLVGFHPHKMRHTAAHRWLAAGGSEEDRWPLRAGPDPTTDALHQGPGLCKGRRQSARPQPR